MEEKTLHFTLDNGNTNPHFGEFRNNQLNQIYDFENFLRKYSPSELRKKNLKIAISSVGHEKKFFADVQSSFVSFRKSLKDGQFKDMKTDYSETIGEDRLYQSYYIFKELIANSFDKILLIDAGTFITCDYITAKGHLGGQIIPGVKLLTDAYNQGKNLDSPKISHIKNGNFSIPKDTETAISAGLSILINSFLKEIVSNFSPSQIILTGGHSSLIGQLSFAQSLKEIITLKEHLIHESLHLLMTEEIL